MVFECFLINAAQRMPSFLQRTFTARELIQPSACVGRAMEKDYQLKREERKYGTMSNTGNARV